MKDWPEVLRLFERYVPTNTKMDVHFKPSDKIILEHILMAYCDYQRGEKAHFIQWCCILVNAIPAGIDPPPTVLAITKEQS